MDTNEQERPAAPDFLRRSVDKAKVAGNTALQTGKPIGETVELVCNTLIGSIGEEGFGFAHSSFAPTFLRQAQDCGLMRGLLVAIKDHIMTHGSFTDAEGVEQVLSRLTPLPS